MKPSAEMLLLLYADNQADISLQTNVTVKMFWSLIEMFLGHEK